jgi:hypothetical protein
MVRDSVKEYLSTDGGTFAGFPLVDAANPIKVGKLAGALVGSLILAPFVGLSNLLLAFGRGVEKLAAGVAGTYVELVGSTVGEAAAGIGFSWRVTAAAALPDGVVGLFVAFGVFLAAGYLVNRVVG